MPASKTAAPKGTKRTIDTVEPTTLQNPSLYPTIPNPGFDDDEEDDHFYNIIPISKNCDQVRRMINALIDNGEMKVSEFQKAIDVSGPSYYGFMRQNGPHKGSESNTYYNACVYFAKREAMGIKPPRKKAKTSQTTSKEGGKASTAKAAKKAVTAADLIGIHLEGEVLPNLVIPWRLFADFTPQTRKKTKCRYMIRATRL